MSKITNATLAITLIVTTTGAAFAEAGHHSGDKTGSEKVETQSPEAMGGAAQMGMMGQADMMDGNHHDMMQGMMKMMMQMHGGMMGGGMMGGGMMGGGMMGGGMAQMGAAGPMGLMDQDMMSLMRGSMMGQFDADADGDGAISGDEAHGQLQSMHANADTDGDGGVTLEEFEILHGEMIRATMVDRFQHLDTDGDGMVTTGEMTAPADRMNMSPSTEQMMGDDMGTQDN